MGLNQFKIQWVNEQEDDKIYWFYRCREKIGKQTLELRFYKYWDDYDTNTIYFSIMLSVYNKRKHLERDMGSKAITGSDPLKNVSIGLRMFKAMEEKTVEDFSYLNIVIFCSWLDKRRREAYEKILMRRGYKYGIIDGDRVLMKRWNKNES